MSEKIPVGRILGWLGYTSREDGVITQVAIEDSVFQYHPFALRSLATPLAEEFAKDQIGVVMGLGYQGFGLAAHVATSLRSLQAQSDTGVRAMEMPVIPVERNQLKNFWSMRLEMADIVLESRVLVVVPYIAKDHGLLEVVSFCNDSGAASVSMAAIANFQCSPEMLGRVKKVRSLVGY